MQQIDNLSDEAMQTTKVVLPDGTELQIDLRYDPALQRWQFSVLRESFNATGMNLCIHPNILRDWRNVVPFGLACASTDGVDPLYVDDFANGRVSLFVLSAEEVIEIENTIIGRFVP